VNSLLGHANKWYIDAIADLWTSGKSVTARGRETREALHVVTTLPDPRRRVLTVPFRRANPFFQAAETVWILAGSADATWICHYNEQLRNYLDKGSEFFHGAYGERLRQWGTHSRSRQPTVRGAGLDQLSLVIEQIKADPGSRRAVAVLRNPTYDRVDIPTLDQPCNMTCAYQLRDGRLYAATFNRSNDLNLGLAYTNIVQFTTIQEYLAAILGADVGHYTHFSSSLHVYDDDPIVKRVILAAKAHASLPRFDVYSHVAPTPMRLPKTLEEADDIIQHLYASEDPGEIECPYWSSVGFMMLAWDVLKNDAWEEPRRLERAVEHVTSVRADDWQIAAFEYLHRWAVRRGLRDQFMSSIPPYGEQIADFITHDAFADATA